MGPQHWMVRFVRDFWVLTLLILLAVNSLLVLGVQGLLVYRHELPEAVESGEYAGSEILDRTTVEEVSVYLLKKPDGSLCTVTLEAHPLTGKLRIVGSGTGEVTEGHRKVVLADSGIITVNIRDGSLLNVSLSPLGLQFMGFTLPYSYIGWSLLLLVVEGTIYWQLLRLLGQEG